MKGFYAIFQGRKTIATRSILSSPQNTPLSPPEKTKVTSENSIAGSTRMSPKVRRGHEVTEVKSVGPREKVWAVSVKRVLSVFFGTSEPVGQ